MKRRKTIYPVQERPLLLVRLHQEAQMRRRYVAHLPWWRHPLIGYIISIPFTALGLLVHLAEYYLLHQKHYFLGAPFFLVTVMVALFWGAGPAICSILLGIIALDYFFLPPTGQFLMKEWHNLIPLIPYFFAELLVAIITAQRERARQRALFAEQEIQSYVDELEQTNEQLKQANQLKDIFFSRASHELKTPLTTIQGQAQIGLRRLKKIDEPPPGLDITRTSLEKIDEQAHRLHGLINDLLDLGMLSAGKMKLRMKPCDLNAICREVTDDQRLLTGRELRLNLPEHPVTLRADCDRITQVILNLVTNAIKYSTPDSAICLTVSNHAADKCAYIHIHNKGPVITEEQQKSIFEPFSRATDGHTEVRQGWGLGLAISKDIIERHQGTISVQSSAEHGTTFMVELPVGTR